MSKIQLLQADSFKFMQSCEDNEFDLLIADPPYGIGMSKPAGNSQKYSRKELIDHEWDNEAPPKEFFDEMIRVSKRQIIWGANHFIDRLPYPSSCWLIWDKRENVIPTRTYADAELAWTSFKSPVRVFRHYWDGFLQKQKEDRIHPTQKPVALYEWILVNYAEQGWSILDPFGGSFSSAIACNKMGYQAVVIELNKEIFTKGIIRYEQQTAQGSLFGGFEGVGRD